LGHSVGVISQERLKVEVELLLSATRKSYNVASIGIATDDESDPEWPFHALRAISAVAALLVNTRKNRANVPVSLFIETNRQSWIKFRTVHTKTINEKSAS